MEKAMMYQHLLGCAKEIDAYLRYAAEKSDDTDNIDYEKSIEAMKSIISNFELNADLAAIEDQM